MRPKTLDDFLGQEHLVGKSGPIRKLIESDNIPSMIFWGPPASGKTSLAEVIANSTESEFVKISAVMDGKAKLKEVLEVANFHKKNGRRTILFIDEIHRWSKTQQDALLPYIENGDLTLIGATTENPSFTVISALLSRSRVFVFNEHEVEDILQALLKGFDQLRGEKDPVARRHPSRGELPEELETLEFLAEMSNGDMRFALNSLEIAVNLAGKKPLTREIVENSMQKFLRYDKDGEEHYNIISAMHKSLRSSNPTAAIYWVARMLSSGEDPLYIARRMLRFASEDVGNASPTALLLANTTFETCQKLGMPECGVALVQLAEYLARAPKSNKSYMAYNQAMQDVKKFGNLAVPMHFRNAPTKLMKDLGYGKDYQYDHDLESKKSEQECLPSELKNRDYFK